LPFTLRVKEFFPNSAPAPAMKSVAGNMKRMEASSGIGQRFFLREREVTNRSDEDNVPAALVEVVTPQGNLGTWIVSSWFSQYAGRLRENLGQAGAVLDIPQEFTCQNKTYRLALRPVRYYKPYSISLLSFTHKRYKGTEIPKDFSSRIRLRNAQAGEDREVLIYMNNPLRYAGETYYQGGFEPGDKVSILQVVRNPAWLTPYLSCTMVGVGLVVHFLMHLINFGKRRSKSVTGPDLARNGKRIPAAEKALNSEAEALAETAPSGKFPVSGKRRSL